MNVLKRRTGRSTLMLLTASVLMSASTVAVWANDADTTVALTTPDDGAQTLRTAPPSNVADGAAHAVSTTTAYAVGDRLKISFFEKVDGEDANTGAHAQLIERTELSGEYVVQDDGHIFLPIFGSVSILSQTPRQLESNLAAMFRENLGRNGKASVVLAEREPVYIVGSITRPGTHKYAPGMTVMHAIALSDGLGATYADFTRASESIRERERLDKATRHLQRLLARHAALIGERDGTEAIVPARLKEIAGSEKASALVTTFATERKLAFAARDARKRALHATIAAAKREIDLLRGRLTHVEASIKNRSERLDMVTALRSKGTFSDHALYQVRGELSDVLEREDSVKASLAQTEEKLAQASHDIAKLDAETQMELHRDLNTIETEVAEEDLVLQSSERLIRAAGSAALAPPLTPQDLSFSIVRRTAAGPKRLLATTTSVLQAGDLLEITRKPVTLTTDQRAETN